MFPNDKPLFGYVFFILTWVVGIAIKSAVLDTAAVSELFIPSRSILLIKKTYNPNYLELVTGGGDNAYTGW